MKAFSYVLALGLALMFARVSWAQSDNPSHHDHHPGHEAQAPGKNQGAILGVAVASAEGEKGARVMEVAPGSPAARAGFQQGDEIVAVDNHAVKSREQLAKSIRHKRPGEKVEIKYRRNGQEKATSVELGGRPGMGTEGQRPRIEEGRPHLGLVLAPAEGQQAVRVVEIVPGSPAAKAGVRVGDVLVSIGGQKAKSVDEAQKAVQSAKPNQPLDVVVSREGKEVTLHATLGWPAHEARRPEGMGMMSPEEMMRRHQRVVDELERLEKSNRQLTDEIRDLRKEVRDLRATVTAQKATPQKSTK